MVTGSATSVLLFPGLQKQQTLSETSSPSQGGLVSVYHPKLQPKASGNAAKYNIKPFFDKTANTSFGERRQNSKSCFSRLWLQFQRCSIPQRRWQFYAVAAIICAGIACVGLGSLYVYQKGNENRPSSIMAILMEHSTGPPEGTTSSQKLQKTLTELRKILKASSKGKSKNPEEMADQPVAPSTRDSYSCHSVTYGAALNCPRAHVLNLTVVFSQDFHSLGGLLEKFPKLQNLTLDFGTFCPEPSSGEDDQIKLSSLLSLEELTIMNSKSCHHLSSVLSFKLPKLQHLRLVNTTLDMQLNSHMLEMLEEACMPRPAGTLKSVEIWHSQVCRDCGFEFDECEAEPSSGYNYIKYFTNR